jgi:hypothetical protein
LNNIEGKNEWKRENQSIQEYWQAHRINHASDGKSNACVNNDYNVRALMKIKKGKIILD